PDRGRRAAGDRRAQARVTPHPPSRAAGTPIAADATVRPTGRSPALVGSALSMGSLDSRGVRCAPERRAGGRAATAGGSAALVDPRADVPLLDDWTYAFSVERLLAGKGFAVSSWSSTFPPAQIAWGTLFAAVGGVSFTTLRLSTLVLAALGTAAFHALLRALGCSAGRALV